MNISKETFCSCADKVSKAIEHINNTMNAIDAQNRENMLDCYMNVSDFFFEILYEAATKHCQKSIMFYVQYAHYLFCLGGYDYMIDQITEDNDVPSILKKDLVHCQSDADFYELVEKTEKHYDDYDQLLKWVDSKEGR